MNAKFKVESIDLVERIAITTDGRELVVGQMWTDTGVRTLDPMKAVGVMVTGIINEWKAYNLPAFVKRGGELRRK